MTCLRNQNHIKKDTVCEECLKTINDPPCEPDLNKVSPEFRALFTQLTAQNRDLCKCWKSSLTKIQIETKRYNIENVLYAFYKADIGNYRLKRICTTIGCINPAHHKSRFEQSCIKKKVLFGYNRELTSLNQLPDTNWLQHN